MAKRVHKLKEKPERQREVAPTTPQCLGLATPSHGLAEQGRDGGMSTEFL
jgi:hypothetical protein